MKFILTAVLLLVLIATPVLAQNGKNEDKSNNGQGQSKQENKQEEKSQGNNQDNQNNSNNNPSQEKKEEKAAQASTSPSPKSNSAKKLNTSSTGASGSAVQCDPNYPWKNHGEYVSCVAKSGAGGQAVSEAARSDIGKKNSTPSASLSPSPNASGSATPSAIVSPTPEATSSSELVESITEGLASFQESIISIGDQFAALLDILNPFN